jgi:predicted phage tail protein
LWAKGWFTSANPPSTPALVSPANSALNTDYMPTLSWRASALPSGTTFLHYRLQVAKDKAFTQELQEKWIDSRTTPFYQYLEGEMLDPDTRYYWRVQAWNTNEHYSTWSAVRYFRTAMVKPTLLTPAEGVTVTTRRPSFEWTPDAGATSYTIQLSVYSNFSTLIRSATPTEPTWTSTVSLPQNKTIYWRVRANGANGPSLWTVGTFKSANPPSTPTLVSPAIGAVSKTLTPKLDWSNSTLPAGTIFKQYELQVATNTAFSGAAVYLVDDRMMSDYTLPALIAKTRYYWRVRAVNMDEHESNWSSRWYFTTP